MKQRAFEFGYLNLPKIRYFIRLDVTNSITGDFEFSNTYGMSIQKLEKTIDYDEDNLASILASVSVTFIDLSTNQELYNMLSSSELVPEETKIQIQPEFTDIGGVEFTGYIDPTSISFDEQMKTITTIFRPRTYLLNKQNIWEGDICNFNKIMNLQNVNPLLGSADNYHTNLITLLQKIFKIVNSFVTIEVLDNTWLLGIDSTNCGTSIQQVYVRNYFLFGIYGENPTWNFGNGFGISPGVPITWMDMIKMLCFDFGLIAGMISENKAVIFEYGNDVSAFEIHQDDILKYKKRRYKYTPKKLTIKQANTGGIWAEVTNQDTNYFEADEIVKDVFGDIYYKKNSTDNYTKLSYAKKSGSSSNGVLIRNYWLPAYWQKHLFDKCYSIQANLTLYGAKELIPGTVILLESQKYRIDQTKINYVSDTTEISITPLE